MFKIEDFQKFGLNTDVFTKSFAAQQKSAQAIATETQDYAKKAYEAGTAVVEKLSGVKALDKALEIQTEYAKASYEGFVAYATKIGEIYTDAAKEAVKPFEAALNKAA